jgi:hypothetical protein
MGIKATFICDQCDNELSESIGWIVITEGSYICNNNNKNEIHANTELTFCNKSCLIKFLDTHLFDPTGE